MVICVGDIIRLQSSGEYRTVTGVYNVIGDGKKKLIGTDRVRPLSYSATPFDIIGHKTTEYSNCKPETIIRLFLLNDMDQ
jgi:hypothetical protein